MKIQNRQHGDVAIVALDGKLTIPDGAPIFRDHLRQLLHSGARKIVLDLGACVYADSAGLGELATALVRVHKAGGRLFLLNVPARVRDLLEVTRLLPLFTLHAAEGDALRAMAER